MAVLQLHHSDEQKDRWAYAGLTEPDDQAKERIAVRELRCLYAIEILGDRYALHHTRRVLPRHSYTVVVREPDVPYFLRRAA